MIQRKVEMKMTYPDIWGRGALFAFSGLDGINTFEDSMCGQLLGERIGMMFDMDTVELYLRLIHTKHFEFSVVASDIILGKLNGKYDFGFIFTEQNTVFGFGPKQLMAPCCHGDLATEQALENGRSFVTKDVAYVFATCEKEEKVFFALSKAKTVEDAWVHATKAFETDIEKVTQEKLAYFDKVVYPKHADESEKRTIAKCFSVMKSQVYTPEGIFKQRWTTPDRLPHRRFWLWDSVFHSMGNVYLDPQLAYESIKSIFDTQADDGFIPHMSSPDTKSEFTQPPVIAWGLYKLYEKTGRKDWLEENYDALERYLAWDMKNRDTNHNYLYEWKVNEDDPNCRCDECGMDNSPRFDNVKPIDSIDFSCYMANEARYMMKIAEVLGKQDRANEYDKLFHAIKDAVNSLLYDEEDGRYYDREVQSRKLRKVSAVSSFLPLFVGICTPERAERLVKDLFDPETYGTAFGVPSISAKDPTFGEDMWRGPVWINYNYFIICGLRDYGYEKEAERLLAQTLEEITKWYHKDGVIYEFYDCEQKVSPSQLSRKGPCLKPEDGNVRIMSIHDYGWSCTFYVTMMMERENGGTFY